ncbi:MAG TPA: imidazolonepropionase, partial [Prolixibacteraceae bacterium]|nr:imidazolonepropionase [Prolixibacteraceae bacterium]
MQLLLENIGQLVQVEEYPAPWVSGKNMAQCRIIPDAFLLIRDEVIADFGPMKEMGRILLNDNTLVEMDCSGRLVLPAWCDSHTHIVYAGSREMEFVGRIKGLTYRQIADAGGGILNSAALLHETSEEDLYRQAVPRVKEMIRHGTGAMEIKSGYGLKTEDELKMMRVIRRLKQCIPV